jgi:hypothetical protein
LSFEKCVRNRESERERNTESELGFGSSFVS